MVFLSFYNPRIQISNVIFNYWISQIIFSLLSEYGIKNHKLGLYDVIRDQLVEFSVLTK